MSKVFVALHSTSHEESNTKYSNDRLFAFSSVLYQRQARTDAAAVDAFVLQRLSGTGTKSSATWKSIEYSFWPGSCIIGQAFHIFVLNYRNDNDHENVLKIGYFSFFKSKHSNYSLTNLDPLHLWTILWYKLTKSLQRARQVFFIHFQTSIKCIINVLEHEKCRKKWCPTCSASPWSSPSIPSPLPPPSPWSPPSPPTAILENFAFWESASSDLLVGRVSWTRRQIWSTGCFPPLLLDVFVVSSLTKECLVEIPPHLPSELQLVGVVDLLPGISHQHCCCCQDRQMCPANGENPYHNAAVLHYTSNSKLVGRSLMAIPPKSHPK